MLALVGVIGYRQWGATIDNPRDAVAAGIDGAKKTRAISSSEEQFLRVQLAIVDYTAKNFHPPDSLVDLIPVYFDTLPVDPASNQPFRYVREENRYKLEPPGAVQVAKAEGGEGRSAQKELAPDAMTPAPEPEAEEEFLYDPSGKRDPYRPFDLSGRLDAGNENLTPLERYTLAQLRLTATAMDSKGQPTGLVEDEAGKGYTVRVGSKVGNNKGVVISIDSKMMKILEHKVDIAGVETETVTEVKIQGSVDDRKKGNRPRAKKRNN